VDEEFAPAFDELVWQIAPEAVDNAATIPTLTAETIFYAAREAVRNAAKYGRGEKRPFTLHISIAWQDGLQIIIEDNGVGMGSVPSDHGSGQGLALHSCQRQLELPINDN
jgi:signal transduction histidine kinase